MTIESPQKMVGESLQDTAETEELELPGELVYERVRTMNRHYAANYLAICVLRRWKRSIPKVAFRPPAGYLEPICAMPIEIVYEILGHLHPFDLYHVSQANRAFRTLLSHPDSNSAWNLAFENHPAIPKGPPETLSFPTKMSELEWAGMLFGKHACWKCGHGHAPLNIPFRLFQCSSCTGYTSYNWFGFISLESKDAVAYTQRNVLIGMSQYGTLESTSYDSRRDVHGVRKAVAGYEDAIRKKEPGARKAFDVYREKRRLEVRLIDEHAKTCLRWAEKLKKSYARYLERRRSNNMKRMRSCSRRRGHHPEDVEKAIFELRAPIYLNQRWRSIKPLLEHAITQAEKERRAQERRILVQELYHEYKKSLSPLTWAYLPSPSTAYKFKPFADLINALHDDEIDREHCEGALRCLPREIENWTDAMKRHLVSLLPERGNGDTTTSQCASLPSSGISGPSRTQEPEVHSNILQLATSVFGCICLKGFKPLGLIGWEGACPHLPCNATWAHSVSFSQRGHDAAMALVKLALLDPRMATMSDMDRLDHRYICALCPIVTFRGFTGRRAYNWRDAVQHYIQKCTYFAHPTAPVWVLLGAEAEADVKHREEHDPYTTQSSWSCALCPEHYENMVSREEAIEHVKSKHNIHTPVETTHFFYLITGDGRIARQQVVSTQLTRDDHIPSQQVVCTQLTRDDHIPGQQVVSTQLTRDDHIPGQQVVSMQLTRDDQISRQQVVAPQSRPTKGTYAHCVLRMKHALIHLRRSLRSR